MARRNRRRRRDDKRDKAHNYKGDDTLPHKFMSIDQIIDADVSTVMNILKTCRTFKVDSDAWPCPRATGDRDDKPTVSPCDAYFDPMTGHVCGSRSRCFQARVQVGASETVKQRIDVVATKAFVRQNLVDPLRFSTFLYTINAAATNALSKLCIARSLVYGQDVVFAFKGGNVMRLVLSELLQRLPAELLQEWEEIMQIGDMDFEVFIDDASEPMVRDVTVLMLYVLYSFRVYMESEGWNLVVDADALASMMTVVPATSLESHGMKTHSDDNITVPFTRREGCDLLYVPVRSVLMQQHDKRIKADWLKTSARPDTALNISMNKMLSLGVVTKQGVSPEADIVLLRLKHGLRVIVDDRCSKKAAAEVIDISIPTNRDRMHRIKRDDKGVRWFTQYEFDLDGRKIKVHAPSIDNFVLDLHMFMFVLSEFPWYDPKQSKRMKRYFWFCTILRSQQGASPSTIVSELGSVCRMLKASLSRNQDSPVTDRKSSSSIANRTSPWAELLQQIDATHSKAENAGIGTKDWATFVNDMMVTAISVRLSYSTFIVVSSKPAKIDGAALVPRSLRALTHPSSLARATLAMAALSASVDLSLAEHPPL